MTRFMPRVREKQLHHIQRIIRNHGVQHFHRIVTHHAQVLYALFFGGSQTGADARECTSIPRKFCSGLAFAIATSEAPMPNPISSVTGALRPNSGEIERRIVELNAHHRPNVIQRMLLPFGQAALAADEATNTAQRAAVFIEFRR
jgi:hypothetical protein